MTPQAEKRLEVLQSLDTLGAGFQLASHDLDLRGAGNLLGEEQSGHIREVGYELYQQMVQDAIERLKAGVEEPAQEMWSPTISLGAPVTIPESYIPDLPTRLTLYRRLSALEEDADIDAMGAEIVDRFGPPPPEVALLLEAGDDQGAVPARPCREARRRGQGADARLPRQFLRQPGGPGQMGRRARARSPASARTCASSSSAISRSCRSASKARWRSCARSPRSRGRRGRAYCVETNPTMLSLMSFPRKR